MTQLNFKELIMAFSDAHGAPGFEDDVATLVKEQAEDLGTIERDKMGNVYIDRKGNSEDHSRLLVQLDAHMDEVAFIVHTIQPNGMITVSPLGGWVAHNVMAHKMLVRTADGSYIPGLTVSKPPHYMSAEERKAGVTIDSVLIDVGTSSYDETVALGVEVGEPIVPDVTCTYDEERDLFMGKAFDCRSGCANMLETMRRLKDDALDIDIMAAFSTQEEVGTRGAIVTTNNIQPDLAIVFEGCPADDVYVSGNAQQAAMGKGPNLRHVDSKMITHPKFQRFTIDIAKANDILHQRGVRTAGATNGGAIHISSQGIPTIVLGVPVRYIHTHYGYAKMIDHEETVRLATEVIRALNDDVYNTF